MTSTASTHTGTLMTKLSRFTGLSAHQVNITPLLLAIEAAVFSGEVSNMDEAEIKGLEMELSFVLTDGLSPRLAFLFILRMMGGKGMVFGCCEMKI